MADDGELVILQGPNGVGKSTIMRTLAGIFSNVTGEIELNGKVCYVGHEIVLHDNLTVWENLQNIFRLDVIDSKHTDELGDKINLALAALKLANKKSYYPWQLSQGQRRKLNLAKLLFSSHPVWLLDEPFVHLDSDMQNFFIESLQKHLANDLGIAVVTSHTPILIADQKVVIVKIF